MGALFKMIESWITHFGLVMSAFGLVDLLDIIIVAFIIYKLVKKYSEDLVYDCDDLLDECDDCDLVIDEADDLDALAK